MRSYRHRKSVSQLARNFVRLAQTQIRASVLFRCCSAEIPELNLG
jgi:hypothetical protein